MKRQPSASALPVILGIEGGGTKTTWALVDAQGKVHANGQVGSGNLHHLSDKELLGRFKDIRTGINAKKFHVIAVAGAFAGCHLDSAKKRAEGFMLQVWPDSRVRLAGEDTRSAYASAHGEKDGLIVIAGTGSNVQGRKGSRWEKAGGWGHIFGDFGGGYDIARRALESAYRHFDETGKTGLLGKKILAKSGQPDLVEFVTWLLDDAKATKLKTVVASLAVAVFEAAAKGDPLAKAAIEEGAAHLADRVLFVTRRLGLKKPDIGLVGSLVEKNAGYRALFEKEVRQRIDAGRFFVIELPGAVGITRIVAKKAFSEA